MKKLAWAALMAIATPAMADETPAPKLTLERVFASPSFKAQRHAP
jgi:hypothetical protein